MMRSTNETVKKCKNPLCKAEFVKWHLAFTRTCEECRADGRVCGTCETMGYVRLRTPDMMCPACQHVVYEGEAIG